MRCLMQPEWVQAIYHQCRAAGAAFFFKQWGGAQKHRTGRELFGRTFEEMPASALPLEQKVHGPGPLVGLPPPGYTGVVGSETPREASDDSNPGSDH
jgi:hypothetical protein